MNWRHLNAYSWYLWSLPLSSGWNLHAGLDDRWVHASVSQYQLRLRGAAMKNLLSTSMYLFLSLMRADRYILHKGLSLSSITVLCGWVERSIPRRKNHWCVQSRSLLTAGCGFGQMTLVVGRGKIMEKSSFKDPQYWPNRRWHGSVGVTFLRVLPPKEGKPLVTLSPVTHRLTEERPRLLTAMIGRIKSLRSTLDMLRSKRDGILEP